MTVIIVSVFSGLVFGFFIAKYLDATVQVHIQEGLAVSATISILTFIAKTSWDVYRMSELQVTYYIWKYRDRHPIHQQAENMRVLTLYVKNVGGGDITEPCVADVMVDGEMSRKFALHWLDMPRTVQSQHSGAEFQRIYLQTGDKHFLISGIAQGRDEIIDVLFTLDKEKEVFLLDSHQTTLPLRKEPYDISVYITAKNPMCTVKFKLVIENWENVNVSAFTVINHTMRAKVNRWLHINKRANHSTTPFSSTDS